MTKAKRCRACGVHRVQWPLLAALLMFTFGAAPLARAETVFTFHVPVDLQRIHEEVKGIFVQCDISGPGVPEFFERAERDPDNGAFAGLVSVTIDRDRFPAGTDLAMYDAWRCRIRLVRFNNVLSDPITDADAPMWRRVHEGAYVDTGTQYFEN